MAFVEQLQEKITLSRRSRKRAKKRVEAEKLFAL